MPTTILDTTQSETGTVVEFGSVSRYEPETIVVAFQVGSGDTVVLYGKVGELDYLPIETFTESTIKSFTGLPNLIRADRTVDGGSGESYVAIT